jgi:hypothetical protein
MVPIAVVVPILYFESGKDTDDPSQIRIRLAGAIAVAARVVADTATRERKRKSLENFMKILQKMKKEEEK